MKRDGNCISKKFECLFLRRPKYHSGYTGKSGLDTWWTCVHHQDAIRNIKSCEFAGNPPAGSEFLDARPFLVIADELINERLDLWRDLADE